MPVGAGMTGKASTDADDHGQPGLEHARPCGATGAQSVAQHDGATTSQGNADPDR